ncbi:hypothetical protein FALBO_12936 [Fusarium albosuccineum]|uniref:Uncharacterized protein n=1 Tax=Fusarium albosuccineum TaxID=1237068 RepID=A0A8H4KZH0_9HYPO|nr:hypothetical protein FALBO_12936 [Fusarium albosuccineum]
MSGSPIEGANGDHLISEEFCAQLQQWLQYGERLNSENHHLRQQIAQMQAQNERLLAYKATYAQMADTQSQLIETLRARLPCGGSQYQPPQDLQIDANLAVNSFENSSPVTIAFAPRPESQASVYRLLEANYPSNSTA